MFYLTGFSYLINFNLNRDTIIAPYVNHRRDVRSKSIKLGFVIRIRVEKLPQNRFSLKWSFQDLYQSLNLYIQRISRYNIIEKKGKSKYLEM